MLRARLIPIFALLSLAACQRPVVPVRNYTFNVSFSADGHEYALSTSYQCHYEDLTWISERGANWHVRKGLAAIRIIGQFADGTAFEVLPAPGSADIFCPENSRPIEAALFIATADGAANIDQNTDGLAPHDARLLQAKLSLVGTGSAAFSDHSNWPAPTEPRQHFYTVQATCYESSLWKQEEDIAAMVRDKTIPWLDDATIWPFKRWTDADVAFARARGSIRQLNGYADAGKRFPLESIGADWRFSGPNNSVVPWHPAPEMPDLKHRVDPGVTRWIEYDGRRIELPLHHSSRVFYEQKSDRLIEFRPVYVDLW